jgi:hypothetical protein
LELGIRWVAENGERGAAAACLHGPLFPRRGVVVFEFRRVSCHGRLSYRTPRNCLQPTLHSSSARARQTRGHTRFRRPTTSPFLPAEIQPMGDGALVPFSPRLRRRWSAGVLHQERPPMKHIITRLARQPHFVNL